MSVFSPRREILWPSGDVGKSEMARIGRSKRPSRTGLVRVGGDVRLSVGCLRHRRCRQAGSVGGEVVRGEMVQPDAVLEVAYGVLDLGVAAMISLQFPASPRRGQ